MVSEAVIAYELGFREQMTERFSWDVATFYNVYDHLIVAPQTGDGFPETGSLPLHWVVPMVWVNQAGGDTYGIEWF